MKEINKAKPKHTYMMELPIIGVEFLQINQQLLLAIAERLEKIAEELSYIERNIRSHDH